MITTSDRVELNEGDRAFNYYDMQAGVIGKIDSYAQPDPSKGESSSTSVLRWSNYWFDFIQDNGTTTSLDGSRICSTQFANRKGWTK